MYMKTKIIKFALPIAAVLMTGTAFAYEEDIAENLCKKPKYTDFSLPEYKEPDKIEVAPESEFEFKISVWSDPKTLKLTGKQEKINFTVESTTTFHRIKAKLPASLTGKFVRIDSIVKAELGCYEKEGWLIKVADKKPETTASDAQPDTAAPQAEPPIPQSDSSPQSTAPSPSSDMPGAQSDTAAPQSATPPPQ